jgi:hypothetical protein
MKHWFETQAAAESSQYAAGAKYVRDPLTDPTYAERAVMGVGLAYRRD